jgi:hypothetical protein
MDVAIVADMSEYRQRSGMGPGVAMPGAAQLVCLYTRGRREGHVGSERGDTRMTGPNDREAADAPRKVRFGASQRATAASLIRESAQSIHLKKCRPITEQLLAGRQPCAS